MKIGDVVSTTHLDVCFEGTEARGVMRFKAPKEERFVLVLIGVEKRDGSAPLDPITALESLGWHLNGKSKRKGGK